MPITWQRASLAHVTQSGLQTRICCAEKSRRLAELVTQTFRFALGNLSTLGLKGEAVLACRKEILKIAVGVTANYSLDRALGNTKRCRPPKLMTAHLSVSEKSSWATV